MIVEDQALARIGLKFVLSHSKDLVVVAEAADGQSAVSACLEFQPAVVLMDVSLPAMSGIEATKRIKSSQPETKVLILTSLENDDTVFSALAAGADGYCLKDIDESSLQSAIRAIYTGACWLDAVIAKRVLQASTSNMSTAGLVDRKNDLLKFRLSAREMEILELLVEGLSNDQMAAQLHLSKDTVKTHMRHVLNKLAVADRTQAAVKAIKSGLGCD